MPESCREEREETVLTWKPQKREFSRSEISRGNSQGSKEGSLNLATSEGLVTSHMEWSQTEGS